ncbi:DASH family cryptochrome [Leptothoe kymatousa]|uniref:Cryptochrome DASH n=1 Tax=Leptothoe kymatousa TAU-MAC 1615 TaxID=2364775 RepID=A0ABS5Y736_9CYAN|nr:DASH family cryptochrome [Leptothoe kymatousa]MBT9313154.1 DASH family cryptochrome [Leptothoe kymatousa TAU-MAC 1615]
MRILLWFRNDLRLHDHEPLHRTLEQKAEVIPVYCFDPRQFGQTRFGFPKTGTYRAQFLLESVADLRASLRDKGADLVVRHGKPEEEVAAIAKALQVDAVYWHEEITSEELAVDAALEQQLAQLKISYEIYWGTTLYHPDDLPFDVSQLPKVFTSFRKKVEKSSSVYPAFPSPNQLPPLPKVDLGELPSLDDLGLEPKVPDPRGVLSFNGGETEALQRLQHYFWDVDKLRVYKQNRNGMLGANYSSKFSPWLALGCISPRKIYEEVGAYEQQRVKNDSTYWLVFELLWRDFFRFICAKHGDTVFYPSGLRGLKVAWKEDWQRFELWTRGETGYPLVDANMRELAATGFMSNRGRQNVASFLTKNLGIDWRMGAEWFESLLIDYDVCSNWGNWNYTAGVGNDARGFRYFNIPKQSKDYDPDGDYVKHWLPELQKLPRRKIHSPWKLDKEEQKRCNVTLGVDYPNPVVDLQKSVQTNEAIYNAAVQIR